MKKLVISSLLCGLLSTNLMAATTISGKVSEALSTAALSGVVVSTAGLMVGSTYVVQGVEQVAEGTSIVLKKVGEGVSEGGAVSIKLMGAGAGATSIVVGQSVTTVAQASGTLLVLAGKAIAFIPNEVGKSLVHSSEIK